MSILDSGQRGCVTWVSGGGAWRESGFHSCGETEVLLDRMWAKQMCPQLLYHQVIWNLGSPTIKRKDEGWLTLEKPRGTEGRFFAFTDPESEASSF